MILVAQIGRGSPSVSDQLTVGPRASSPCLSHDIIVPFGSTKWIDRLALLRKHMGAMIKRQHRRENSSCPPPILRIPERSGRESVGTGNRSSTYTAYVRATRPHAQGRLSRLISDQEEAFHHLGRFKNVGERLSRANLWPTQSFSEPHDFQHQAHSRRGWGRFGETNNDNFTNEVLANDSQRPAIPLSCGGQRNRGWTSGTDV